MLESNAHAEAYDGRKRAVGNGRSYKYGKRSQRRRGSFVWKGRGKVNVREIDNGKRAQSQRMLWVGDL